MDITSRYLDSWVELLYLARENEELHDYVVSHRLSKAPERMGFLRGENAHFKLRVRDSGSGRVIELMEEAAAAMVEFYSGLVITATNMTMASMGIPEVADEDDLSEEQNDGK